MSLIDKTYFRGPIMLAQLGDVNVTASVQIFIDLHEKPFLQAALGYDLWVAFNSGITAQDPEQKWKDLRDGIAFTNISGIKKKWVGFADGTGKLSPIASYVYWHIQKDNAAQTAGVGVVKTAAENATSADPSYKMVTAWNQMLTDINILWEFLEVNKATYSQYDTTQVNYKFFGALAPNVYYGQNQFGI